MRIPVKIAAGRFLLLDAAEIYFIESDGDDVWVRTARKRRYRGGRRLAEWEVKLDPPANAVLPVGRAQVEVVRDILGL